MRPRVGGTKCLQSMHWCKPKQRRNPEAWVVLNLTARTGGFRSSFRRRCGERLDAWSTDFLDGFEEAFEGGGQRRFAWRQWRLADGPRSWVGDRGGVIQFGVIQFGVIQGVGD